MLNSKLTCPYCKVQGLVGTRQVKVKRSSSGARSTGSFVTGGLSVLTTGLSKRVVVTEAACGKCNSTWYIDEIETT
jgi:hypothetical protein